MSNIISPRVVPSRDAKYMGEAWMKAAFSKDPSTQVGAVIIDYDNKPLGSGYNGPPRLIDDDSFSWDRPPKDNPDAFSKYDVIRHAEVNAIRHCRSMDLRKATMYVTALPCPDCMLDIIDHEITRVVYFDYQSSKSSSLQNAAWREKSFAKAKMAGIHLEKFQGDLNWLQEWIEQLKQIGVFGL